MWRLIGVKGGSFTFMFVYLAADWWEGCSLICMPVYLAADWWEGCSRPGCRPALDSVHRWKVGRERGKQDGGSVLQTNESHRRCGETCNNVNTVVIKSQSDQSVWSRFLGGLIVKTRSWLGGVVVSVSDSWSRGRGFDSQPLHYQVTTLGKSFTHMFLCYQGKQYNLVPARGRWCSLAGRVTVMAAYHRVYMTLSPAGWLPTVQRDQLTSAGLGQLSLPSLRGR